MNYYVTYSYRDSQGLNIRREYMYCKGMPDQATLESWAVLIAKRYTLGYVVILTWHKLKNTAIVNP